MTYAFHMLATVVWIGGLLFQALFVIPVVRQFKQPESIQTTLEQLRRRFQPVTWLALMVLIGTGLIQMAASPSYEGFLAIESTWSKAILLKHLAIGLMLILAAYQSFVLFPKLSRNLLRRKHGGASQPHTHQLTSERNLLHANVLLSILTLLFTAIARVA